MTNALAIQSLSLNGDVWRVVLDAWLNTLDSENTRRAYRLSVGQALEDLGGLDALDAIALAEYRQRWVARLDAKADQRLSPASVARRLAALRSFLHFARLTGQVRLANDVINLTLKSPKATVIKPYQILTREEASRLVGAARGNSRDRVLLTLALATGLRAQEICNIIVGDISQDDQGDLLLRVRQGKGRKDRIVPISDDASVIVRAYLAACKIKPNNPHDAGKFLFESRKGKGRGQLTTARLRQLIAHYKRAAEIIKPISMHSTRHTLAINLLKHDVPLPAVQKILGHESLATTQKYVAHFELEDLKAAVNQV